MKITDEMLYEKAAQARALWLTSTIPEEVAECKGSYRFRRRMKRLIREQRRTPRANQRIRVMRRTAAVVLAAVAVSFSCLMTVEAYREKFVEVITHVFDELTDYRFSAAPAAGETDSGTPALGFLPDALRKTDEHNANGVYTVCYTAKDGAFLDLSYTQITENQEIQKIIDTEGAQTETLLLDGETATVITKGSDRHILWTQEDAVLHLYSNLPLDTCKQIVAGITIE